MSRSLLRGSSLFALLLIAPVAWAEGRDTEPSRDPARRPNVRVYGGVTVVSDPAKAPPLPTSLRREAPPRLERREGAAPEGSRAVPRREGGPDDLMRPGEVGRDRERERLPARPQDRPGLRSPAERLRVIEKTREREDEKERERPPAPILGEGRSREVMRELREARREEGRGGGPLDERVRRPEVQRRDGRVERIERARERIEQSRERPRALERAQGRD